MIKAYFNRTRTAALCLFAVVLTVTVSFALLEKSGRVLISLAPYLILNMLSVLTGGVWAVMSLLYFIRHRMLRRLAAGAVAAAGLVYLLVLFAYGPLFASLSYSAHYIYTSPDGSRSLVVIESGFIDASISAYPLEGIFYLKQDNGYLSYHDVWSTAEGELISVQWNGDREAVVSLRHEGQLSNPGSNEDHKIRVLFE